VTLTLEHRGVWCESMIERISLQLRGADPIHLNPGPVASAAVLLATSAEPFLGRDMIRALAESGLSRAQAAEVIGDLFELELIYSPHLVDIGLTPNVAIAG